MDIFELINILIRIFSLKTSFYKYMKSNNFSVNFFN